MRNLTRTIRRLVDCRRGVALTEFGLILPVMLMVCFGIVEFALVGLDFVRAGEAARRATRVVSMSPPLVDLSPLPGGVPIVCTVSGTSLSCNGTYIGMADVLNDVLAPVAKVFPDVKAENLRVTYADSGIGDITTPGGIKPLITVDLVGITHKFLMLGTIPGVPDDFVLPPFSTTLIGNGVKVP
jgi:hypothetical protein